MSLKKRAKIHRSLAHVQHEHDMCTQKLSLKASHNRNKQRGSYESLMDSAVHAAVFHEMLQHPAEEANCLKLIQYQDLQRLYFSVLLGLCKQL